MILAAALLAVVPASVLAQEVRPTLGADLPRYEAPAEAPEPPGSRGTLTLQQALALSLLHNPDLAAHSWELRAREAEALQAGAFANPMLGAELENFAGAGQASGFDNAEFTLQLSQFIELGGKRGERRSLAERTTDLAWRTYDIERVRVFSETRGAFIAVLAAQDQLELAEELTRVAAEVLESITRRVRAGGTSPVEASRARVALQASGIEQIEHQRALDVARATLASQWGAVSVAQAEGSLGSISELPTVELLLAGVDQSPEVMAWAAEVLRRDAELELAGSQRVPDVEFAGGVRHFAASGDLGVVAGVSISLPVFNRYGGQIDAASARRHQAERSRQSTANQVRLALQRSVALAEARAIEAVSLRDTVLPEAAKAFELASAALRSGRMRLTDVLDTQRTLFELRSQFIDALVAHHLAVGEIERLTGQPITDISPTSGSLQR